MALDALRRSAHLSMAFLTEFSPTTVADVGTALAGTGVSLASHWPSEVEIPAEHHALCVDFFHEGLANALRHSHSDAVHLDVSTDTDMVILTLTNDTCGDGATATYGFGLTDLSRRAAAAGGSVTLHQGEEHVALTLSLPAAAAA